MPDCAKNVKLLDVFDALISLLGEWKLEVFQLQWPYSSCTQTQYSQWFLLQSSDLGFHVKVSIIRGRTLCLLLNRPKTREMK